MSGGRIMHDPPEVVPILASPAEAARAFRLTPAEVQALASIAAGLTAPEAAKARWESMETERTHRNRVLYKLGARNAAEAVAIAFRAGVIT